MDVHHLHTYPRERIHTLFLPKLRCGGSSSSSAVLLEPQCTVVGNNCTKTESTKPSPGPALACRHKGIHDNSDHPKTRKLSTRTVSDARMSSIS